MNKIKDIPKSSFWGKIIPRDDGLYHVFCSACKTYEDVLSLKQIKAGASRCPMCFPHGRTAVALTAMGKTLSIKAWTRMYPTASPAKTIRQRHYYRNIGKEPYDSYTDAELIFGRGHLPREPILDTALHVEQRVFAEELTAAVLQQTTSWLEGRIIPKFFKATPKETPTTYAGQDLVFDGIPLQELLDSELTPDDIILTNLQFVTFNSLADKMATLSDAIPLDASNPHKLTKSELMCIFSPVTKEVLDGIE